MLATVKLLQSKNASTGTISMSKRLMAINEAFSANLGTGPILSLPNGSARPLPAPATKPNLCVTASTALSVTSCSSASNGSSSSNGSTSHGSSASQPPPAPIPAPSHNGGHTHAKPSSLILVPHHELSNGRVKGAAKETAKEAAKVEAEDSSCVRLVSRSRCPLAQAKEVQTVTCPAPAPAHSPDCPYRSPRPPAPEVTRCPPPEPEVGVARCKSSDPLSENSDDYLELPGPAPASAPPPVPELRGETVLLSTEHPDTGSQEISRAANDPLHWFSQ